MKIGLYFGSFNPIHTGHLIIASFIADNTQIDQVWFIVSPQNPLKQTSSLLNEYDRLHLVKLAVENDKRLKVSDVEFKLPKPSYTIDTLTYLSEKYPIYEFVIILGSDSYLNLPKWKSYEILIKNYSFFIYQRPNFEIKEIAASNFEIIKAPLLDISSTLIRQNIKATKSIRYLVTDKVADEIERSGYYK